MTQPVGAKPVVSDENGRVDKSDAVRRFNMVQRIREEIIAMLAAKKRGFSAEDY